MVADDDDDERQKKTGRRKSTMPRARPRVLRRLGRLGLFRDTASYLQRFLITDPGKDPYERNANSRGDVCEDRGFHYDGLSFVDAHKAQFSVDFDEYERYKNAFQNGLCHHQFKTKFDDMRVTNAKPLVYADDDPTAGFGSRVLRICSAFFASVHFGRPFAYAKVGRWTYSKCASRGNDCYFQKITSAQTEYETPEGVYRGEGALVKEEVKDEELIWTRGSLDGFQKEYNAGVEWMRDLKAALNGLKCRAAGADVGSCRSFCITFYTRTKS